MVDDMMRASGMMGSKWQWCDKSGSEWVAVIHALVWKGRASKKRIFCHHHVHWPCGDTVIFQKTM